MRDNIVIDKNSSMVIVNDQIGHGRSEKGSNYIPFLWPDNLSAPVLNLPVRHNFSRIDQEYMSLNFPMHEINSTPTVAASTSGVQITHYVVGDNAGDLFSLRITEYLSDDRRTEFTIAYTLVRTLAGTVQPIRKNKRKRGN